VKIENDEWLKHRSSVIGAVSIVAAAGVAEKERA
jgi:hypothetical protein